MEKYDENVEMRHKLFKEGLERRNKVKNEMPELKAGMIVEYGVMGENKLRVVLPATDDNRLVLVRDDGEYNDDSIRYLKDSIVNIYTFSNTNYYPFFCTHESVSQYNLIWSRKSDSDIKIEELEATIKKAAEQIQEIKDGNK